MVVTILFCFKLIYFWQKKSKVFICIFILCNNNTYVCLCADTYQKNWLIYWWIDVFWWALFGHLCSSNIRNLSWIKKMFERTNAYHLIDLGQKRLEIFWEITKNKKLFRSTEIHVHTFSVGLAKCIKIPMISSKSGGAILHAHPTAILILLI